MTSNLSNYTLHLADNSLILGHRNSEWTGHGPILEQDIALSNIALDQIGQARSLYQYAAEIIGGEETEDTLAYFRDENEFRNCLLVEQDNGDWGKTILRQFLFSAYQYPLYEGMINSGDDRLSAIAEKSLKEVTYHLRWSSEWVIRLGKGTEESHTRMQNAVKQLWMFTSELYTPAEYEMLIVQDNVTADFVKIKTAWNRRVGDVMMAAGLDIPANVQMMTGGKEGRHTHYLKELLGEMQYMQRTYPGAEW